MCEPVTLAALAVAAAGSGIQYSAQKSAAKKQEAAINAAQAEQTELGGRRQEAVVDSAQNFVNPQNSVQAAIEPAQARLEGVAESASQSWGNKPSQGLISQDYEVDSARRAADEMRRAIEFAQTQAKGNAGQRSMFGSGLRLADDSSKVDDIGSLMRQASARGQANIQRAGRVNAGQMALGSFVQGASGSIGRMGGGPAVGSEPGRDYPIAREVPRRSIFG